MSQHARRTRLDRGGQAAYGVRLRRRRRLREHEESTRGLWKTLRASGRQKRHRVQVRNMLDRSTIINIRCNTQLRRGEVDLPVGRGVRQSAGALSPQLRRHVQGEAVHRALQEQHRHPPPPGEGRQARELRVPRRRSGNCEFLPILPQKLLKVSYETRLKCNSYVLKSLRMNSICSFSVSETSIAPRSRGTWRGCVTLPTTRRLRRRPIRQ